MSSAKFGISGGRKLRPNQVALIGKKKQRRSVGCHVNTGPLPQLSDGVGLPPFVPRAGIKADKQPSGTWAVNKIIPEERSRGVAQNATGARRRVGPENFCRRPGLVELKHQAADEQADLPRMTGVETAEKPGLPPDTVGSRQ